MGDFTSGSPLGPSKPITNCAIQCGPSSQLAHNKASWPFLATSYLGTLNTIDSLPNKRLFRNRTSCELVSHLQNSGQVSMVTGLQLLGRANSEAAENAGVNSEYKEKQHLGSGSTYS